MNEKLILCANCAYSKETPVSNDLKRGLACLKNPPVVIMVPTAQGAMLMSAYPDVTGAQGCYSGKTRLALSS